VEKGNVNEVPAIRKGSAVNHFARSLQTPKASVVNFFSGELPYTLENRLTLTMFKQILDLVYMEKVREDEGGTYGVQTSAQISSFPEGRTVLQTYFDTDPAKRAQMNSIVHNELKRIAETGPRPEDFNKTKENLLKKHAEALQENSYWLNTIDTYYFKKRDDHSTYDATLNAITPASIQNLAKSLLKQGNTVEVVMEPSH
jgi:zinc protease